MNTTPTTQEALESILATIDALMQLTKLLEVVVEVEPLKAKELVRIYTEETNKHLNGINDYITLRVMKPVSPSDGSTSACYLGNLKGSQKNQATTDFTDPVS